MNEQKIEGNDEELEALKEMLQDMRRQYTALKNLEYERAVDDNTQLITAFARLAVRYVEED